MHQSAFSLDPQGKLEEHHSREEVLPLLPSDDLVITVSPAGPSGFGGSQFQFLAGKDSCNIYTSSLGRGWRDSQALACLQLWQGPDHHD